MTFEEIAARLRTLVPDAAFEEKNARELWVQPTDIARLCKALRDDPETDFQMLTMLTGYDALKDGVIEMTYVLFSFHQRHMIWLKTRVDRTNAVLESVVPLWNAADWFEREVWDLLGVTFTGHPDLRRILCPPEFVGHGLRKDYERPGFFVKRPDDALLARG